MVADDSGVGDLHTIGQVVAQLTAEFPDVTHSSLRFLEREGLITPARTPGGHRLFPNDQIERIRRIKTWQLNRLSLEEIRERLHAADQLPDLGAIAEQVLELLVEGDRRAASQVILEADDAGVPLDAMFDGVIRPALEETGKRWESGQLSVGQEKEISSFLRDLIAQLGLRHRESVPATGPTVIAACVDGEQHELGLAMVTAILREHDYLVHYLGASVSSDFLIERIKIRVPDAVLLSVVQKQHLASLERTIAEIRADSEIVEQPLILVGGAAALTSWKSSDPESIVVITALDMNQIAEQIDRFLQRT